MTRAPSLAPRDLAALALAALALAAACACNGSVPGDPDARAFRAHPSLRVEPIPGVGDLGGAGPHDARGFRVARAGADVEPRGGAIVLGGAGVYGAGARAADALPARAAERIAAGGRALAVANAACPGECAASAMLRFHFEHARDGAAVVAYVAGAEDLAVYASSAFAPDLQHVPRPWTGTPWPPAGALREAGAAAFERDVASLATLAQASGARAIFALPAEPALAPLREPMRRGASSRGAAAVDLPASGDAEALAAAIAEAAR